MNFNYDSTSVRALVIQDNKLLVEWFAPKSISFLPGGRIEGNEPLTHTLVRELEEELGGIKLEIAEYLGKIGHIWSEGDAVGSCLNHFYEVRVCELTSEDDVVAKEPTRVVKWLSLETSETDSLQPPSLAKLVEQWRGGDRTEWDIVDKLV